MNLVKLSAGLVAGLVMFDVAVQAAPMPPVGQWQCVATNNRGTQWVVNSESRGHAIKKARQRCYAQGSNHCYVSRNDCRFNNGKLWTCRVRDHHGRIWRHTDMSADLACRDAEHACRHWHNTRGMTNYMCKVVSNRRT